MSLTEKAREAQYLNILRKIKGGKVATAAELAFVEEYEEGKTPAGGSEAPAPAVPGGAWIATNAELTELFGVTTKTICEWAKNGMPRVKTGTYNFRDVFIWWRDNINTDPEDSSTAIARARYWTAKAEQAEIETLEKKGEYIPRADVVGEWCKRIAEFRQGCLAMPVRLPAILEGKTAREMRALIEEYARVLLETYSREGKYCPTKEAKRCSRPKNAK